MSRILVTGAEGQLGRAFQKFPGEYPGHDFIFAGRAALDICSRESLEEILDRESIDICINCAAYTAVDRAETETEIAEEINYKAVCALSDLTEKRAITLVHFSTDFVFDGTKCRPYLETDRTRPLGVYGQSKLQGESYILRHHSRALLFRTSWLYSSRGHNFLNTMLRLGAGRESLGVVFDQAGTPTYCDDLASAVLEILLRKKGDENYGLYHYSNEGVCTWYDFAVEIMKMAGLPCRIEPIRSEAYPTAAKRPAYSVLDKGKVKETFEIEIPHWRTSLEKCLEEIR